MTTHPDDDSPLIELPRHDLRETAFRKYEHIIGVATKRTVVVPRSMFKLSQHTLCCRLRDAILAIQRYNYYSTAIPAGFNFSILRVAELADGTVAIINSVYQTSLTKAVTTLDRDSILATIKTNLALPKETVIDIRVDSPADRAWLNSLERETYPGKVYLWDNTEQKGFVKLCCLGR